MPPRRSRRPKSLQSKLSYTTCESQCYPASLIASGAKQVAINLPRGGHLLTSTASQSRRHVGNYTHAGFHHSGREKVGSPVDRENFDFHKLSAINSVSGLVLSPTKGICLDKGLSVFEEEAFTCKLANAETSASAQTPAMPPLLLKRLQVCPLFCLSTMRSTTMHICWCVM